MSLKWYQWPRLVVLSSDASALEAARALENNQIGMVIVQERGRLAGVVTDRDLALRVVGQGLDPKATTLGTIMSGEVATLSPAASRADALRLMELHKVRRIPLVDGERLVGVVTLDDLLLHEEPPVEELARVVRAQVGIGGPLRSGRALSRAERRRAAHAEGTFARLLAHLRSRARLDNNDQAETALEVVLTSILRRLTPDEAEDLIAQLPSLLHGTMRALEPGPDKLITRDTIEGDLVRRLDVEPARAAEILEAVGATLEQSVSAGQIEDVRGQLPESLRSVFPSVSPNAPPPAAR